MRNMFKKIRFESLVIETTRRCNMRCAHCLRGEAENYDMPVQYVRKALENVESINTIVFTGGEPSLNVSIIRDTLDICKERDIPVYGFFVATNGKKISDNFVLAMLEWYAYCVSCGGEPEGCSVSLSTDEFHEKISRTNIDYLKGLSFFQENGKYGDFKKMAIINRGRAKTIPAYAGFKFREIIHDICWMELENDYLNVQDGVIYISADGKVKDECDSEFLTDEYVIGNLNEESLFETMSRYYDNAQKAEEAT